MSKTNKKEELKQDKVMTKYDRKMQERKEKAEKEKKDNLVSKILAIVIAVVVIAVIVISIVVTVSNQRKAVSGVFMKVGEHEVSSVEYDYYYNITLTDSLSTYSSLLSYMGFDSTTDYHEQAYDENRTWGDIFDEMAVEEIKESKAMLDDANAAGFVYENLDAEYQLFLEGFAVQAEAAGMTISDYYKMTFGEYATQARVEPFIKETLFIGAYADKLMEDYKPTEEEITARYEEDKNNYDTITYSLYTFSADVTSESTEDEIATAMADAEAKANEMKEARLAGEEFQALCNKYDAEKGEDVNDTVSSALGENKNTIEGATHSLINTLYADWMYDNARKANDIEIFVDESNHKYYVVEFIEKVYEEDTNDVISNEISTERVNEYKATLIEKYEVVDVAGELKYLTLPAIEETTEEVVE